MRILITGATGFIGSEVTRQCVAAGHAVRALVRPASDRWRLADVGDRVRWLPGDVLAEDWDLDRGTVDVCIHLAWDVTPGHYLEAAHHEAYWRGTVSLARRLAAAECGRLVAVGTCFEYDPEPGVLTEATPTRPRSVYARCKLRTFESLEPWCRNAGLQFAWARLFHQYGPAEDPRRLVPYVIRALLRGERAALTAGEQVRDFLHVRDVAAALCALARCDAVGAFNVGSGQGVSVAHLARRIGELVGRPELLALGARTATGDEPPRLIADASRVRAATGWSPNLDLEPGLRHAIEWWAARLRADACGR